nr:immunoglobulin heavy chain junction region [Macaca mulatta]
CANSHIVPAGTDYW